MVIRFDSKLTLQNGGSNTLNSKASLPALSFIPEGEGVKFFKIGFNNSVISYLLIPSILFSITFLGSCQM